jgi:hypothetical protein
MGGLVRGGNINIVRQVTVDEGTLQKIAELLGIQGQVISGTIYVSGPPSPAGGTAPPSPPGGVAPPPPSGGTAPPSPASGRRRSRR